MAVSNKYLSYHFESGFWISATGTIYKEDKKGNLIRVKQTRDQGHNGGAYLRVYSSKSKKRYYSHRLVAMAFVANLDPKFRTEVNHKNMNVWDNNYSNLEWLTPKENRQHARDFDKSKLSLGYRYDKEFKKWVFLDNEK